MKASDKQPVIYRDMGRMGYQDAWDYQESLLAQNVRIKSESVNRVVKLIRCLYPPVITFYFANILRYIL